MSNKRKPTSALFPKGTGFPESRKMSDTYEGNMSIYEFFDHLLQRGYVLARRDPETGRLLAMKTVKTVEHEVLVFRGVDKIAYALENSQIRAAYPHLVTKYGIDAEYEPPMPEFADQEPWQLPDRRAESVSDDKLVSLAQAWRMGVFTMTPSHSGVRVKMTRCRRLYPDLMPKMIPRGSQTFYRVGDLRDWEAEYTKRANDAKAGVRFVHDDGTRARDLEDEVPEQPVGRSLDGLALLMSKIRGEEEEDVPSDID